MPSSFLIAVLLLSVSVAQSVEIIVGGEKGWTTGFDYDAWATSQNFQPRVGDSLLFMNYDRIYHTVALLDSADDYQRCTIGVGVSAIPIPAGKNISMPILATLEGKTLYAVCTVSGHCTEGQKMQGTVLPSSNGTTGAPGTMSPTGAPTAPPPNTSDADVNRYICWTTAILLIAACFWNID